MQEIKLDVHVRQETGSARVKNMRRGDFVPGIVYGGETKPTAIKVDRRSFERIRRGHEGENIIFHLNVLEGEKKLRDDIAIVKEEQHDPVTDDLLHLDFNRISLKKKMEFKVPIIAKGEPIGVKQDGGSLDHVLWELDVICLPTEIPKSIEADVSQLKIGDSIHIKDLRMPEGVTTKQNPDSIVFHVVPPMKEEVAAPVEAAPTEVEVLKEKKDPAKKEEGKVEGDKKPAAEAKPKAEEKK